MFRVLFILFMATFSLRAQSVSLFDFVAQDSILDIYLKADWKLIEKTKLDKTYHPGLVTFRKYNGDSLKLDVKFKTRGHMRLDICSNPPLKLKFDKQLLTSVSCSPMNELDLVQACHKGESYDQLLLREFLAYRLYNIITPYSFRVQLVRIYFINQDNTTEETPVRGFIVENEEELVDRLHGQKIKLQLVSKKALDRKEFLKTCLFQFMIGNTDWYIPTKHNLKFVALAGHDMLVPIPYDFDYAGIVSAPYAAHHQSINLHSVSTRYYQGWCEPEAEVMKMVNLFIQKKESIMQAALQIPGLNEKSVRFVTSYLEEFYNIIENPRKLENLILSHCDMWPVPD